MKKSRTLIPTLKRVHNSLTLAMLCLSITGSWLASSAIIDIMLGTETIKAMFHILFAIGCYATFARVVTARLKLGRLLNFMILKELELKGLLETGSSP